MIDRDKSLEENNDAPDSWCVLPWAHVSIKGNGTFRPCCHSAASESRGTLLQNGKPFHISTDSWEDVINSDQMKNIRLQMLDGKWPEECVRCEREHNSGMISRNIYERSFLADITEAENYPSYKKALQHTSKDGTIKPRVSFLDIRFGNLCNLKCNMCSPTDSNQWYDDYNKVWGYTNFIDTGEKNKLQKNSKDKMELVNDIYNWSSDKNLWKEVEQHISEFRRLYIVGGEPLLIDSHYTFLQKCIDEGYAKNLTIEYNSNITNIPEKAWAIWKHFKNIVMGASIDGMNDVNNIIRFPSNWNTIENNLKRFSEADDNIDVHISCTVQLLNCWQLPEFIEYILTSNYKNIGPWPEKPILSPHPVHRPKYLNINILPNEFKQQLINRYNEYKEKFITTDYSKLGISHNSSWENKVKHACKILDQYIEFMNSTTYKPKELTKARSNCIHFLDKLDEIRGTSWEAVCPELHEATLPWRTLPKDLY